MSDDTQGPGLDPLLSQKLGKSEAGHREITERKLPLSRSARNLLLLIEPRRSAGHWLSLVKGSSTDEMRQLLAAGLVQPLAAPPAAVGPSGTAYANTLPGGRLPDDGDPAPAEPAPARTSLANALKLRGYRQLYDRMTAEARPQLGLLKGYKLILEVERCTGPDDIRALALQFVEQVRAARGAVEARALSQRLADPPSEP